MKLITAHRILIGTGMAFFVFYAVFQGRRYLATGSVGSLVQVVVSLAVVAGLGGYYRTLSRWGRR